MTKKDKFAALFSVGPRERQKLFDAKGAPSLLAELKHTDRQRYEKLIEQYRQLRIPNLAELQREVDQHLRAVKAAQHTGNTAHAGFQTDDKGRLLNNPHNIRAAIEQIGVKLRYDTFRGAPIIEGLPSFGPTLDDAAMNRLWLTVTENFDFSPVLGLFQIVVADACRRGDFHPVLDYLDGLDWDGAPRIDTWLIDYCKAADTPFNRAVSRLVLIAAVRRVRKPGVKFDVLTVLESPEGFFKSAMLSALAVNESWFTDSVPLNVDDKKMIESTGGKWIAEFGELAGMRKGEVEKIKAQLSRQTDRARLAYGKLPVEVARQFVGFGTTNSEKYLAGLTGNRRFWPVKVGHIDLKVFRRDVDQLWAEAAKREAQGESIVLDESLWKVAGKEQAARELVNPFEEALADKLGDKEGYLFIVDAWRLLNIQPSRQTQHDNERLGSAMKALRFRKVRRLLNGNKRTAYVRGDFEKGAAKRLIVHESYGGTQVVGSGELEESSEVMEE